MRLCKPYRGNENVLEMENWQSKILDNNISYKQYVLHFSDFLCGMWLCDCIYRKTGYKVLYNAM